jgi:hypothetical protein
VGRHVLEDVAIEGYRTGRLSHRQFGQMLGLDYWQSEAFLKERGVLLNYTAADLEADSRTFNSRPSIVPLDHRNKEHSFSSSLPLDNEP